MKKGRFAGLCCPIFVLGYLTAPPLYAQEDMPFTRLFDTGSTSAQPLTTEGVAKRVGWTQVPEDKVDHPFAGDAVFLNDKLAVVLRKQGHGAEVYAKTVGGLKHRAAAGHTGTNSASTDSLSALKIIENTFGSVMVEATFKGAGAAALRFRITTGESILEIRAGQGASFVNVQSKTRQVVVPDFFGDDMVFETAAPSPTLRAPSPPAGARENTKGRVFLPAENFCLHLIDGGDAIMMAVWQSSQQDAILTPSPTPGVPAPLQVGCLPGKSIWLAFLESPGLWHAGTSTAKDDWKPPFPAKWRCSLAGANGVADSLEWGRELVGKQVPARPFLVYPIDRSVTTPLTATCPTDVMRNTLGVGPCQYILACEGLSARGDPTPNTVMNWVEKQFEAKKDRKAADDIRERLGVMTEHVADSRKRIERYREFAGQARSVLSGKPGSEPFLPIVDDLDRFVATGLAPAASPEQAKRLADEVAALIGKGNSLPACQRLGEKLRAIGAVQDGTLARCRMAVRRLRQEARSLAVNQSQHPGVTQEVQRLAEQMLSSK